MKGERGLSCVFTWGGKCGFPANMLVQTTHLGSDSFIQSAVGTIHFTSFGELNFDRKELILLQAGLGLPSPLPQAHPGPTHLLPPTRRSGVQHLPSSLRFS